LSQRFGLMVALLGATLGLGCAKGGSDDGAKRTPEPPPHPDVEIPADLSIPVDVDGKPAPPIDAKRLKMVKPDYSAEGHRAWKLVSLLGTAASRPGAIIEAAGAAGVSVTMRPPKAAAEPQPVLTLTRRGDVAAAVVTADDPFPDYHGRGGRLRRPGDPLPRVFPVTKLRVLVETSAAPPGLLGLGVTIDGKPLPTWAETVAGLPSRTVVADGENRPAWSARDIASKLGEGVRLAAVMGTDGRVEIKADDWAEGQREPVLRTNRRGTSVKLEWADKDGTTVRDTEIRGISALEFVRK
jgi:hypothetical protein